MMSGFVYKITCLPTGKSYVGQTKEFKMKQGKQYNYGISGRWNDHCSTAKTSITPFAEAIRKYGRDSFQVEELEKASLSLLDALEAKWIAHYNTVVPNGYNKARHSRTKNRLEGNLHEFFQDRAVKAVLSRIHKAENLKLVYVNVYLKDGTTRRIVFGQNKEDTFQSALQSATVFIEKLGCPWSEDTSASVNPLERYASKIDEFRDKKITKIVITNASSLIAVYITTDDMKSWKDQKRICFGGKTICKEDAYNLAKFFVDVLPKTNLTTILDKCQSPQQAAAPMGEVSPSEKNSVNTSTGSATHLSESVI